MVNFVHWKTLDQSKFSFILLYSLEVIFKLKIYKNDIFLYTSGNQKFSKDKGRSLALNPYQGILS